MLIRPVVLGKKSGRVGHLTFQCKNFVSLKESNEKNSEAIQAAVLNGLDKLKGGEVNGKKEVERVQIPMLIPRLRGSSLKDLGKKVNNKGKKPSTKNSDEDDGSDSDYSERKKRRRSKKRTGRERSSEDSDDENEGTRKKDESLNQDDDHCRHRKRSRKEKRSHK